MPAHDPFSPASGATPPSDGDAPKSSAPAEAPATDGAPVATPEAPATEQPTPEPTPEPEAELEVPQGTSKEVMEWVGDDKERAAAALAAEQASGEPRKGLTRDLEELLG